jgi:hypothetical protein
MPSQNIVFRTTGLLLKRISIRDPKGVKMPGATARRDLERWYSALEIALSKVKLDPAEAVFLIKVVGTEPEHNDHFVEFLGAAIQDSDEEGFEHVRARLIHKVSQWDFITLWAVVDACERYVVYQARNAGDPKVTLGMALHQVGLHSYMVTPEELAALEAAEAAPPVELEVPVA